MQNYKITVQKREISDQIDAKREQETTNEALRTELSRRDNRINSLERRLSRLEGRGGGV